MDSSETHEDMAQPINPAEPEVIDLDDQAGAPPLNLCHPRSLVQTTRPRPSQPLCSPSPACTGVRRSIRARIRSWGLDSSR